MGVALPQALVKLSLLRNPSLNVNVQMLAVELTVFTPCKKNMQQKPYNKLLQNSG